MESAFSFLSGLVETFEDVGTKGKKQQNQQNQCSDATLGLPSCGINVTNSTEDYCGGGFDHYDVECQDLDGLSIRQSASNKSSNRRKKQKLPSLSEKKSFGILKSSLLQSFSKESSNNRTTTANNHKNGSGIDVTKSRSNLSNTTKDASTDYYYCEDEDIYNCDDGDFSWANSLSFNDEGSQRARRTQKKERRRRHHNLPPPPSRHHIQWFAHGVLWTCMAIGFGWAGVGLSYFARQSTSFVELEVPMYLDPRYETIPQVGMIRIELCFNQTHLDILEDLNENDFLEKEQRLELGVQPRTRTINSAISQPYEYYDYASADDDSVKKNNEENDDMVVEKAPSTCIVHRLTSDDIDEDVMYRLSQSVAFLAMVLGGFVTICLTFSAFWKTINLRPIGGGLLVAYFLQSFTFLVFDSSLCKDHAGCSMSEGGIYSAVASVCFILSCAACARMDRRKFRNDRKEQAAALEQQQEYYQDYYHRSRSNESQESDVPHPSHIVIEKEILIKAIDSEDAPEKRRRNTKKKSQKQSQKQPKPTKPKPVSPEHRSSTAETANISSSDEGSASNSADSEKVPQEVKEDPIYIPALPDSPPTSERSLKKKSKKPRSASSVANSDQKKESTDTVEKPKKPRSKSSKSKKKPKSQTALEEKSNQSSISSSSLSTKERIEKPKRKGKGSRGSERQVRSLSPSKSIDMAGDVVSDHVRDIIKNSAWISDKNIDDIINGNHHQASPNSTNGSKRSSSRPRRSKSNPRPMRESVRKSIEEGKHYEL